MHRRLPWRRSRRCWTCWQRFLIPRRAECKFYRLPYALLFSILVPGYRHVHRARLNAAFGLKWRRAPAHTAIRYVLQGLDPAAVEAVFRAMRLNCWQPLERRDKAASRWTARRCAAERVRHRHRAAARPGRHRREVQRNSGDARAACRTRQHRQHHRHPRCAALPKKLFEVAGEANVTLIVQVTDNQPTLRRHIQEIAATPEPPAATTRAAISHYYLASLNLKGHRDSLAPSVWFARGRSCRGLGSRSTWCG